MRIQATDTLASIHFSRFLQSASLAALIGVGGVLLTGGTAAQAAAIVNSGFETGDLTGWSLQGVGTPDGSNTLADNGTNHTTADFIQQINDGTETTGLGEAVTSLGDINPTEGNYFVHISNYGSGNGLEGSFIYQLLGISAGMSALSFDVRFLTTEEVDSEWDFGGVALVDATSQNVLREFVLDHDPTTGISPADAHATEVAAGGFDVTTPWISQSFDLTGLAGTNAYFVAYVTSTGDTSVESQLLLDNVSLRTTDVPEPATLSLFAMGLIGLGFAARKRKSA